MTVMTDVRSVTVRYKRPHFYPAAANGTQPSIPIFMLTREDGERIIAEKASGRLSFQVSSTRCSLDRREVAPNSNESTEGSSEIQRVLGKQLPTKDVQTGVLTQVVHFCIPVTTTISIGFIHF